MRNRTLQWIILSIILLGVGYVIYHNIDRSEGGVQEGEAAPDFTLPTLDGSEITLSQLRGKAVLINFWASYCKPCREEMPAIQKLYEKYKDHGFEVIAVNTGENAVTATSFIEQVQVRFPTALDRDLTVVKRYGIGPLPASFFIAPDGTVHKRIVGQMSEGFIEKNILETLPKGQ